GAARQYFNHNRGFVTEIMCDMNAAVRSLGHSAMAAQHRTSYERTGSSELWHGQLRHLVFIPRERVVRRMLRRASAVLSVFQAPDVDRRPPGTMRAQTR